MSCNSYPLATTNLRGAGGVQNRSQHHDILTKKWGGAPEGCSEKVFLLRKAYNFDESQYTK